MPKSPDDRPIIGVSMNYTVSDNGTERSYLDRPYIDMFLRKKFTPLPIPVSEDIQYLDSLLEQVSGVLFTGGCDLNPALWNEPIHPETELIHPRRQEYDFLLYRLAQQRQLPIMGICLGAQMINVAEGGSLFQHLPDYPGTVEHGDEKKSTRHKLIIHPQSRLYELLHLTETEVYSAHHQGINRVGENLLAAGVTEDGVCEAVEKPDYPFLMAVQWHPERDMSDEVNRAVIDAFLQAVRARH